MASAMTAAVLIWLAVGQAGPVVGTPVAGAPVVVTLREALQEAATRNLDLKAAQARLEQAKAGVWKAWSGSLPQVVAGGSYTRYSESSAITLPTGYYVRQPAPGDPPLNDPPAGGSVPGAPTGYYVTPSGSVTATIQKIDQLGAQVDVTQVLLAPALWGGIKAAYLVEDATERSVEAVRREVLFGTAQAYYGVASLKQLAEVSRRLLEIAQRQEKDAEVRYRAGSVAKVSLIRAQIDRARAEQDVLRADNNYRSGLVALAVLLDRAADFDVVEPPEPPAPGAEGLEDAAARDRPDVQAARLAVSAAEAGRTANRLKYLPNVGAFFRMQWANVGGFTGSAETWSAGVALSWNLLDGGLREAEIRESGAKVAQAQAEERSAELRARAEVQQALLDLESARANAVKAKEQRDLAAENQRLVDVSYKAGAATAVEQADATSALRNAELAWAAESLQAQLAAVKVLKAAGSFDPVPRG